MLTPKENYLMVLSGEIPEYVPSHFEPYNDILWNDDFGTPVFAPDGPKYSPWGVKYVGTGEIGGGAIPEPNNFILSDIRKWRDVIKNPDINSVDFESYYKKETEDKDRANTAITIAGGDYFQDLVSFMGFTEALIAMHEEPEEVYALLSYISEYKLEIMKQRVRYTKPDVYMVADDCAAAKFPFFSLDMYRELIKPFHKKHADIAMENGIAVTKHDCGRSEGFIDDWLDFGVKAWNPAQTTNDLKAVKKKYSGRLTIEGGWEYMDPVNRPDAPDDEFFAAVDEYVQTFAPGGGFVFTVMMMGPQDDNRIAEKSEKLKKYFFEHVRNYYQKH
jgi:hypothetical protein